MTVFTIKFLQLGAFHYVDDCFQATTGQKLMITPLGVKHELRFLLVSFLCFDFEIGVKFRPRKRQTNGRLRVPKMTVESAESLPVIGPILAGF